MRARAEEGGAGRLALIMRMQRWCAQGLNEGGAGRLALIMRKGWMKVGLRILVSMGKNLSLMVRELGGGEDREMECSSSKQANDGKDTPTRSKAS